MALLSPSEILNLTISDLLADPSLEFYKQGSTITFSTPDGIITIEPKLDCGAKTAKAEKASRPEKTKGSKKRGRPRLKKGQPPRPHRPGSRAALLEPQIMALRAEGKTQREIAEILHIKQGYVSTLERQAKKRVAAGGAPVAPVASVTAEPKAPETAAEKQD